MDEEQAGSADEIVAAINNVADAIGENNRLLGVIANLLESIGSCM